MEHSAFHIPHSALVYALAFLAHLLPVRAEAIVYNLRADVTTLTLPGNVRVGVWGFARDSRFGAGDGQVTVPGPLLTVPAGDTTLTVHLQNNLTQARTRIAGGCPVSLLVPALPAPLAPVYWTSGPYSGRVRSLTTEILPGNTAPVTYTWQNVRPGTFLYQSGTQMQVQVQMGLYGSIKKDQALRMAYPGVAYDRDVVLLYSEIDPALHQAVVRGDYGPGKGVTSTLGYRPRYFMVNGRSFTRALPWRDAVPRGRRILLRLINAGLQTHVPLVQGMTWSLVAENGNLYPRPRKQYTANLAAGSTTDVLLVPNANGRFAVFDRMLNLTNAGAAPGGLMSYLDVVNPTGGAPAVSGKSYAVSENGTLSVAAPGVLAGAVNPDGSAPLVARLAQAPAHGALTLNVDGSVVYRPQSGFAGSDGFAFKASNAMWDSAAAQATIAVKPVPHPPRAVADHYTITSSTILSVAAPGVLVNDTDPAGQPLTAVLAGPPSKGTLALKASGAFTYRPAGAAPSSVTFKYQAAAGMLKSAAAPVTIKIAASDTTPTAKNLAYTVRLNKTLTVATPGLLAGAADADGDTLMATLAAAPAHGTVALRPNGAFTYAPQAGYTGRDTFGYAVSDGLLRVQAAVTLTVGYSR